MTHQPETDCPTPETHNWGCGCPTDVAAAIASCPGREVDGPSPCRCPCEGCKHNCSAHQSAAVPAAVAPPTNQATAPVCRDEEGCHRVVPCDPGCGTRDLLAEATRPMPEPATRTIAEAALAAVETALCDTLIPDAREEALARPMKVLPPTTDRAAILREAADRAEVVALRLRLKHDTGAANGAYEVMDELRRMADETATETPAAEPTAEEIAREHVTSLHLIGEQLATIESWFWEHLADVRDAGARQDGAQS